jgi:hypothetical protein
MVQDLSAFLCSCKANGDQISLFLDANEDMTNGYMQHMLLAEDLGMREAVLSSHPTLSKTATYMKGDKLGKNPIDGAWVTDDIASFSSGWLAFHKCPGDHQITMVDIDSQVFLVKISFVLYVLKPDDCHVISHTTSKETLQASCDVPFLKA